MKDVERLGTPFPLPLILHTLKDAQREWKDGEGWKTTSFINRTYRKRWKDFTRKIERPGQDHPPSALKRRTTVVGVVVGIDHVLEFREMFLNHLYDLFLFSLFSFWLGTPVIWILDILDWSSKFSLLILFTFREILIFTVICLISKCSYLFWYFSFSSICSCLIDAISYLWGF